MTVCLDVLPGFRRESRKFQEATECLTDKDIKLTQEATPEHVVSR